MNTMASIAIIIKDLTSQDARNAFAELLNELSMAQDTVQRREKAIANLEGLLKRERDRTEGLTEQRDKLSAELSALQATKGGAA